MNTLKITIIGGGSSYTPELVEGFINRINMIPLTHLALVDVEMGKQKLETISKLTRRMLDVKGLQHIKLTSHYDLDTAIEGSKFVLTQFRVGQLPARAADERLGLKYDLIGQETTGVGGFAKALRTIPVMINIAQKVETLAPDAWIINFTNPAGIVTEAISRFTKAKIIGLCNVPITMHHLVADMLEKPFEDIKLKFTGLNHMVWAHDILLNNTSVLDEVIDLLCSGKLLTMKNIKEEPWPASYLRAIKAIPCPYHHYYLNTNAMLKEEIEAAKDGGTRAEQVMDVEKRLFKLYDNESLDEKPEELSFRGGSFYSSVALELVSAIYNDSGTELVVNTANNGCIEGLQDDAVIETNCIIDAKGAHPIAFGKLQPSMHALTVQIKEYERLTIEASINQDKKSALLALITNPLINDVNIAEPLLNDLFEINKEYIPVFS